MARDASGNYTLPLGNPVVTGTIITTSWANSTLADLATAMTDSLSRSGQGSMTAQFRAIDGNVGAPGLGFASETSTGLYRLGAGTIGFATSGSLAMLLSGGRLAVGAASVVSDTVLVGRNIDGAINAAGLSLVQTVGSGVTNTARAVRTTIGTAAASFTLTSLTHFSAEQGTFGAGSTVASQAGFFADSSLIGATFNYGFRGILPAGANRWNLYMDGAAPNHIGSDLRLGVSVFSARGSGQRVLVEGTNDPTSTGTVVRNSADANGPSWVLGKTRSAAVSGTTIVASGDTVGDLQFAGSDGTSLQVAASVRAEIDGSPSAGVMPGRLILRATNPAGTLGERARIDGTGLRLGSSNNGAFGGYLSFQPSFRNRIHNPMMLIAQRGVGPFTITNSSQITLDRWFVQTSGATRSLQVVQSTDAPDGFPGSLSISVVTGQVAGVSDLVWVGQGVEGFNIADFRWGTALGLPITISFWIRSSLTGSYSSFVMEGSLTRSYVAPFTISVANVWEYKTIQIPAEIAATWATANTVGLFFGVDLGSGSNVISATPSSWDVGRRQRAAGNVSFGAGTGELMRITGVQIERGIVPTPCERRDYVTELQLCQRYYETGTFNSGGYNAVAANVDWLTTTSFLVQKRAAPTITKSASTFTNVVDQATTPTGVSFIQTLRSSTVSAFFAGFNWAASAEI